MIENDILEFIKSMSDTRKEVFITYYDLIEDLRILEKIQHDNIPEIIQATILRICNIDEVKDCYLEFKNLFNTDKERLLSNFKETLDTYCKKESICTNCGADLIYDEYLEDRGEYFGFPCSETIHKEYCPYCY